MRKEDPDRMATVLYVLGEVIRRLGILAQPFVPGSAAKMLDQLAVPAEGRDFTALAEDVRWPVAAQLPKPQGIFPRHVGEDKVGGRGGSFTR